MPSDNDIPDYLNVSPESFGLTKRVSPSWTRGPRIRGGPVSKPLKPFATEDIKILLLENVNQTGRDVLEAQGYQVTFLKSSLPEDELIEKIR